MNRCDDNNQTVPIRRDVLASRSFCKNRREVFYDQIVHFYVNLYFSCIFIYTFGKVFHLLLKSSPMYGKLFETAVEHERDCNSCISRVFFVELRTVHFVLSR